MLAAKYSNQASDFLKKAEKTLALRIIAKIELMEATPFPPQAKKLEGSELFRIRVGDYRILYEVDYPRGDLGVIKMTSSAG